MGIFDFMRPVPHFRQDAGCDSTGLQIESLLYLFQRLHVHLLAAFTANGQLRHLAPTQPNALKLDAQYNVAEFERLLVCDKHRVLIDFPKNKFRLLCILSEEPETLPPFKDNRRYTSFRFSVLPLGHTTRRDVALFLAQSNLYCEHSSVSFSTRLKVANEVLVRHVKGEAFELTQKLKALLVHAFLCDLAVTVQTFRIYDEYARRESPRKALQLRPSIANLRVNEVYNPEASPRSPEKSRLGSESSREMNEELWAKCRQSVAARLAREESLIRNGH